MRLASQRGPWLPLAGAVLASAFIGCAKPEPPKIKPLDAKVTSVSLTGLEVELKLEASNPNAIPLSARKVKAHVTLDGKIDLGDVTIPTKTSIPAHGKITLTVPLSVGWSNVAEIGLAAASKESMDFKIEGEAEIGGDSINFDIPFETTGTITRGQLTEVTTKAIPGLPIQIPSGLKLPF
jgi:LEA14-like dessication related protein